MLKFLYINKNKNKNKNYIYILFWGAQWGFGFGGRYPTTSPKICLGAKFAPTPTPKIHLGVKFAPKTPWGPVGDGAPWGNAHPYRGVRDFAKSVIETVLKAEGLKQIKRGK